MTTQFNWNLFPSTRLEEASLVTPVGCIYTPFESDVTSVQEAPLKCSNCGNVLNCHIKLDRTNGMWWCPLCEKKNFGKIDEQLFVYKSNTVLYDAPGAGPAVKDAQVIVLDTYHNLDHLHFDQLVRTINHKISEAPESKFVLITFNDAVEVHQPKGPSVGFGSHPKELATLSALFNPQRLKSLNDQLPEFEQLLFTADSLKEYLGSITPKLSTMSVPARAAGYALFITSIVLASLGRGQFFNVTVFLEGPGTQFPGKITDVGKPPRSHSDIELLRAPYFLESHRFYSILALVAGGHLLQNAYGIGSSLLKKPTEVHSILESSSTWSVNLYTGSVQQSGAHEMRPLIRGLCGNIYMYELFTSPRFVQQLSFHPPKYVNAELTVTTLDNLKVGRFVFGGMPMPLSYNQTERTFQMHSDKISDKLTKFDASIGKKTFTNRWRFPLLQREDALGIFFNVETVASALSLSMRSSDQVSIQYTLRYFDIASNKTKLLVTTIVKPNTVLVMRRKQFTDGTTRFAPTSQLEIGKQLALIESFDQHTWSVLLGRLLVNKIDQTLGFDHFDSVVLLADEALVELLHNFGGTATNEKFSDSNPYSLLNHRFHINPRFSRVVLIFYSLRKNPQLFRIFNLSPDETSYYHQWFLRLLVEELVKAIEPHLYKFDGEWKEVGLDASSLKLPNGTWLVLDNQFSVVMYKVVNDPSQRETLHHSNNDARIFNRELPQCLVDYLDARSSRLVSKFILTQTDHSQLRFLHSNLIPDDDPNQGVEEATSMFFGLMNSKPKKTYESLLTDDASLQQYYSGIVTRVKEFSP